MKTGGKRVNNKNRVMLRIKEQCILSQEILQVIGNSFDVLPGVFLIEEEMLG